MRPRLLRITTVPESLLILLNGQLEFMQQHGFEVMAVSSRGPQVEALVNSGIIHRPVSLTRKITPFTDLAAFFQLILIILRFRPAIVHTHTPKAGLLGMLAAWVCRVPVRLHTVAGLPLMEARGIKRHLLLFTERLTYAAAHHIYPNSIGLMDFIAGHIMHNKKKMKLLGRGSSNGINTAHYLKTTELQTAAGIIRANLGIPADGFVFGFAGRIVNDKGIKELLRAFKKTGESLKNVFLLLVGATEDDLDPIDQADKDYMQSAPNIFMAGYQHDVRPWMLAMDVFVFPSYREGFPNVVMQAACLELPCIVSDINGCNEIIYHNKNGLVVPAKNADALADSMLSLVNQHERRMLFGKRAREFVIHNFDQQVIWHTLLTEYRTLLGKLQPTF